MQVAGRLPLEADRWTPFNRGITFMGVDLTGAMLRAQVRLYPDAPSAPLVDLLTVTNANAEGLRLVYASTDTVANHIAAGGLQAVPPGMSASTSLLLSLVNMRINETTMEGLVAATELGGDALLAWDMHVTRGGLKQRWLYGPFTVLAGVTQ